MIICSRKIEFDAAHRIIGHESKCRFLHGHRYVIEAKFIAESLDNLGRVVDFSIIKTILGGWIDANWDHNVILCEQDKELGESIENIVENQKIFYLPFNPTAENMAIFLLNHICPELFKNYPIKCHSIKLYETPNCFVEVNS